MKVLIVDDEPIARNILNSYLLKISGAGLVGKCGTALEAFSALTTQQVDPVLLDINMPGISGIDLIESLKNPPMIIFTTAYSEYAVKSYELNAVDYLVKPIPFDRFLKAMDRAFAIFHSAVLKNTNVMHGSAAGDNQILFVKSEGKLVKVDLAQLWLVEGLKDYVRLWTNTGKIMVLTTMKSMEEQLSGHPSFLRINKSYIVNVRYINEVDGNTIRIKDQSVTIGNTYRAEVYRFFDKHKLL